MSYTKRITLLITTLLLLSATIVAQNGAEIKTDIQTYDFGIIAEADGLASHSFTIQNTGKDPLVITRITASCGCTQPEWTKAPIEPGKTGSVKISYNPKGRPGPFHKSIAIHSNAKNGRMNLYVKGNVTPKSKTPAQPIISYPYSIGDLKLQTKSILYSSIRPGEIKEEKIAIKNEGTTPITIRIGKIPNYLKVTTSTETLKPGGTSEFNVIFNTDIAKRMGRLTASILVIIENEEKKKDVEGKIDVAANVIDNFGKLSASDKAKAPAITFSTTLLDFGKLPEKGGGIIPFISGGGKESESLIITNTGKSTLTIYSVTCDNEHIDISGGRKELKPGAATAYKVTVRPKEIKTKLETFINIVCNDPNGPVRLIKVTAEK